MITKKEFCEIFDLLIKQREIDNEFEESMNKCFTDSCGIFLLNSNLWDAALQALAIAANDKYDYISWWVFEDDMKGRLTITEQDGTEYAIHNPEELYDLIYSSLEVNEKQ